MKSKIASGALLAALLSGCATSNKLENETAKIGSEVYFAYNERGGTCYMRFLADVPLDGICVKGNLVVYEPAVTVPRNFSAMPDYVTALFNSKTPPDPNAIDGDKKSDLGTLHKNTATSHNLPKFASLPAAE